MKRIYIATTVLTLFLVGCTDKFDDFNTDKKNPAVVQGNWLFTNGEKALADQVTTSSVNQNVFRLWAQYWTETTYTDESNYLILDRDIPGQVYRFYYYQGPLKYWDEASKLISQETDVVGAATKDNRLAIIQLLRAYAYQQLVDIFGMVPYSEALNIDNVYPKYDDGASIYADLLTRIDAALATLANGGDSFGSADLLYQGDVDKWIKFGNSLKIKIAISMADVNSATAKTVIESSAASAFTSSADDCLFPYVPSSPNYNPVYADIVTTGRKDFVPANTLVDKMNTLNDPRRSKYFTDMDGAYVGGQYGYSNSYANFSHLSPTLLGADFPGTIMTYTEVLFYLSEAAARGYSLPMSAAQYYTAGIRNSIVADWGGTDAEATTYLAQPNVAYATAPDASADGWREKIGTQAWIANYTNGLSGYTTWRRLDYPVFNVAELISSTAEIPTRFTFPVGEQTLNPQNYTEAAQEVGGDLLTTKIWWDKYNAN